MNKRVSFLPIVLLLALVAPAQTKLDSLWRRWQDTRLPDTLRLKALQEHAWSMIYNNPDSTATLGKIELEFARQIRNKKWEAKAMNVLGGTHHVKGEYVEALKAYQDALTDFREAGEMKSVAAMYNNIGLIYREQGNNTKSFEYYDQYLKLAESLNDKEAVSSAYNNLGTLHSDLNNLDKALEYYTKALQMAQALNDRYGVAIAYNNAGSVYYAQKNFDKALDYFQKSIAIRDSVNDRRGLALVYNNIGLIYKDQGRFEQSLSYFNQALKLQESLDDQPGLSTTYFNLGTALTQQGKFARATMYCAKGLKISEVIGAIRPARNACSCLYEAYKGMGQSSKALQWHERLVMFDDSLQTEATNKRLEQLEFEKAILTDSLMREEEKQQLKASYQADLNRKTQSRNLALIIGIGVLLLALVFLARMLIFQKRSERLQSRTRLLEKQQLIHEIDLLKTQVNPHFLFNSLSILSSLVHLNADLSEQFIDQLSRSYRYILDQKDQTLVRLRTELEFIRSYAFLLQIRFEKKFDLQISIEESDLDRYKIAPLTLQLLIENAVKHNRMSVHEPLIIQVALESDYLIVKNRLRPRPQREYSTGTGLNNIIQRYALLSDRSVRTGECEDDFVVRVPLL